MAAQKVIKGKRVALKGILRDATTKKLLKSKSIGIYRLVGKSWKLAGVVKTNAKGAFTANVRPTKATQYRLIWSPTKTDRVEYASYTSKTFTVSVRKK